MRDAVLFPNRMNGFGAWKAPGGSSRGYIQRSRPSSARHWTSGFTLRFAIPLHEAPFGSTAARLAGSVGTRWAARRLSNRAGYGRIGFWLGSRFGRFIEYGQVLGRNRVAEPDAFAARVELDAGF